ncbi:hypothetical protein [Massilia sp. CF038]|uniref:hypothetical protein n=1 Tax=Massilia sp. CF038 TaxID=1881045 RepID=UPI0009169F0E|nr:hypothetical protein [Massilia sp. CF038]SHG73551.1 hypothetical protein SAMN05428948_1818 [Massilia sp. CF038]
MHISFTAHAISISPVDGIFTIALLERTSGEGKYLLLKRGNPDGAAGNTGFSAELCGHARLAYGAIDAVDVGRNTLRFAFSADGARLLGAQEACIAHELKGADFSRLLGALKRILGAARIRHTLPTSEEIGKLVRFQGEAPDMYGQIDLFVPAFERHFPVQIELKGAGAISDYSTRVIADILSMNSAARAKITGLLCEHALKTSQDVRFGEEGGSNSGAPASLLGRLRNRFGKQRFIPIPLDDPRHPCYLENGSASVEQKVEWLGFRIDERAAVASRLCVLDCRAQWDEDNGVTLVIRNGVPVATSDADVNIEDFDRP